MTKSLGSLFAGVVLLMAEQFAAAAALNAVAEAVQVPAWVERGGASIALAPGMELRDRDRLRTGAQSKLLLKMRENSFVRLGENGTLLLDKMAESEDIVCLIEGKIEVQRGQDPPFQMDQPLSFYVAPRGAPAVAR